MNRPKIVAFIPARMAATRFPQKPLAKILGLSMIEHVRRRVEVSKIFNDVYVATCDLEIKQEVEKFGGKVIMTKNTHERCTDRIEEAATKIEADIIVNVQGDEPVVMAESLHQLLAPMYKDANLLTTNIVNPILSEQELDSPNVVKAVLSKTHKILYMSRSRIPGKSYEAGYPYYKQTGLMAFQKKFLHLYAQLAPNPLEIKESCDMLRVLEHDYSVQGIISEHVSIGVDVPEQISQIEDFIMSSPIQKKIFEQIK